MSVHDIILETARDPLMANTFNYASMAWNNHFFFNGIVRSGPSASTTHSRA